MPLVALERMLDAAAEAGYALPAANVTSSKTLHGVLAGLAQARSDGIAQTTMLRLEGNLAQSSTWLPRCAAAGVLLEHRETMRRLAGGPEASAAFDPRVWGRRM